MHKTKKCVRLDVIVKFLLNSHKNNNSIIFIKLSTNDIRLLIARQEISISNSQKLYYLIKNIVNQYKVDYKKAITLSIKTVNFIVNLEKLNMLTKKNSANLISKSQIIFNRFTVWLSSGTN